MQKEMYMAKTETKNEDVVNHPDHYKAGKYECLDIMIERFGKKAVADFCICNVFKYTFRSGNKQPKISIEKAKWYLEKYMELAPEFYEEWRMCDNGLYEVSSLGNVRRVGSDKNRQKIVLKNGYETVILSINGKVSCHYVHRLIAKAFLPNPNNLREINHKNHIRTDNRVENLEWCTGEYNMQDAHGISIYVYNLEGDFIEKFPSVRKCEECFNFGHSSINRYIDTDTPKGNLLFYTTKVSNEYLDKIINKYTPLNLELLENEK